MSAKSRRWFLPLLLSAWSSVAFAVDATPQVPADFAETYDELAALFNHDELSAMDMASGTYAAAKFFAVGKPGLPYAQERFLRAATQGDAGVGGLFVTVNGRPDDLTALQRDLETSKKKRAWLMETVGTQEAFFSSIESGAQMKDFLRVLPSTEGPRQFSIGCMQSKDTLVRRAGMYWGYWFTGPAYWSEVKQISSGDPDTATRRIAARLMNPREKKPE